MFKRSGGAITHTSIMLNDYDEQAGCASGHYFHQDLLVATLINQNKPSRHLDIGSRIDGFVAHVASFRKIEVMDVRALKSTGHENISFIQADLMDKESIRHQSSDSISCLHAIEHFGLGRYGDPINPNGHKDGYQNILSMLTQGGVLYISFPISRQNEVHFNAHRVFHPKDIFTWSDDPHAVALERFDYIDDDGSLHQDIAIDDINPHPLYGCGVYTFRKLK